ncbi:hypothetical protein CkaCkLH20_04695 [Colletotrichum karsti]|uniref:Mid2 domain-containing protein n=1 Tax=Colletotrichum karsti TaxID=1095194 RepID=A0A9P6LLT1_9PEZI|nr:uncharacterized protein CkaCkLH20_04695 [Colletotrichum karsti]KAF9877560.1 hypothetical protein CkaCkLH20_04695 [Colletotrichum karsti]
MRRWLLLSAIVAFIHHAAAVNQFHRPAADGPTGDYSENPAYEVGKDITFLWDTDFDQIDLVVWSDASDKLKTSLYKRLTTNLSSRAFTWKPSFDGFPVEAQTLGVFYLTFYQAGTVKQAAQSHYFNITQSAVAAASASTTSTATTASASPASATPSENPSSTTTDSPSDATSTDAAARQTSSSSGGDSGIGLSAGMVAGIAVGVAVATMLIVGAAGFMAWRKHNKKQGPGDGGDASRGDVVDNAAQGHYAPSGYAPTSTHVDSVQFTSTTQYDYQGEWKNNMPATPVELDTERTPELGNGHEHAGELNSERR